MALTSAVLRPFTWSRDLISNFVSGTEKEALVQQVEELKTQLQRAQEHSASQEQMLAELSSKLELETSENKTLWDQIEYLTNDFHRERRWRQEQADQCQKERNKALEQQNLRIRLTRQLEEKQRQLVEQKRREELLVRETQEELEKSSASYYELHQECGDLRLAYDKIQERYDTELKMQTYHAGKVSEYRKVVQSMKRELADFRRQMEQEAKTLQKEASEREKALCMELENLNVQLHEQTSKNTELKAEADSVQHEEEMKDQVYQQEEESLTGSQDTQPLQVEPIIILQDQQHLEQELLILPQDQQPVEVEPIIIIQNQQHVEQELLILPQDPDIVEEAEVCEEKAEEKQKRPSFWKRTRHFFGLRRRNKRRRQASTSNSDTRVYFSSE